MTEEVTTPDVTVQPTDTPIVTPVTQPTPAIQPNVQTQNFVGETVLETSINVFAAGAGIDAVRFENAIEGAIKHGDPSLINMDALTVGLKPEQALQARALAQAAYQETQAAIQRASQESISTAERLAGGAEQWKNISNTFNTKAPAHLKAVVSQMLDTGDVQNAVQFVIDTAKGVGLVNSGDAPMQGGFGGNGADSSGISQAEYFEKLATLERAAGNRSFEQGEYANKLQLLRDARKLGRNNGL